MFKCNNCRKISLPRQPEHKIITEYRDRVYSKPKYNKRGKPTGKFEEFEIKNAEIVTEISVCPSCYEDITGLPAMKRRSSAPPIKVKGFSEDSRQKRRPRRKSRKKKSDTKEN